MLRMNQQQLCQCLTDVSQSGDRQWKVYTLLYGRAYYYYYYYYTHQLLAYAADVNLLGGSIHTLKENAEALVDATRQIGLEVSPDKTKYMVMSRDQNMVLRRIFGPRRDEVTGEWRRLHNEELNDFYSSPNIVRVIKSRRMRWAGHVARMG